MGSKPGNRPSGIALLRRPEPGTAAGGAGGGSTRPLAADSGAGGGASRTSMARRGRGTGRWATGPGGIGGRLPLDVRCGRELELEFWGDNGAALLWLMGWIRLRLRPSGVVCCVSLRWQKRRGASLAPGPTPPPWGK